MASRVLHEGLLDSARWHGVSHEAARLFVALLLLADDFGLVLLTSLYIGRHAFAKRPSDARLEKLIAELVAADLLRVYWAGDEKSPVRCGFLPRFRQRMRQMRAKHPMPPRELYADDLDAAAKFSEFKALFAKMPAGRLQPDGESRLEVKGSEGKESRSDLDLESEKKGNDLEVPLAPLAAAAPSAPAVPQTVFLKSNNINGNPKTVADWAEALNLVKAPGERDGAFQARVAEAKHKHFPGGRAA